MPISDDGTLVGEPDGQSFGVGVAPRSAKAEPSSVVQLKKKEEDRKRKKAGRDTRRWVCGPVIHTVFTLNQARAYTAFSCSTQLSMKCIMLIDVKNANN